MAGTVKIRAPRDGGKTEVTVEGNVIKGTNGIFELDARQARILLESHGFELVQDKARE